MYRNISLNGEDWKLTGWWEHQWRFTESMELGEMLNTPVPSMPAKVPGAVQLDLLRAGFLPDPNVGMDSTHGEWVANREWFYDKEFTLPEDMDAEKYILVFEGLDYHEEIWLNGSKRTEFAGMFLPVELDITGILKRKGSNFLRVVFYRPPEVYGQFGYSDRIRTLKSRFNYIWDWCPRIVPTGIWEDVYIKAYSFARITDFYPKAAVEGGIDGSIHTEVEAEVQISGRYRLEYRVSQAGEQMLVKEDTAELTAARQHIRGTLSLKDVKKWWPSGQGEQPLYDISVTMYAMDGTVCDAAHKRIGFRTVEFMQNLNAPVGARPYTLVVNSKRVFIRGVNWVPISPFYGGVTREEYRRYIQRFKDMNCNILRVWGGAILEKKDFYDVCDEMGILVLVDMTIRIIINKLSARNAKYLVVYRNAINITFWQLISI